MIAFVHEPAHHVKAHPAHAVDPYVHLASLRSALAAQHFSLSAFWFRPPQSICETSSIPEPLLKRTISSLPIAYLTSFKGRQAALKRRCADRLTSSQAGGPCSLSPRGARGRVRRTSERLPSPARPSRPRSPGRPL